MITFKAVLFILSCFTFVYMLSHLAITMLGVVVQAITTKNTKATDMTVQVWLASLSFTYIMSYLFIW